MQHKNQFLLTRLRAYISVQNASCAVEIQPLLRRFQNHPVIIVVQQGQRNSSTWILRTAVYLHVFHQDGTCEGEGMKVGEDPNLESWGRLCFVHNGGGQMI